MLERITLVFCLVAAPAVAGAACDTALSGLRNQIDAGSVPMMRLALDRLDAEGCNRPTQRVAARRVAGAMARQAQGHIREGRLDQAQEILRQVPALHWLVQSSRADIAMVRGRHGEAAKLYNDALDTLSDPALTVQRRELVPVIRTIAQLAQENMMLAGTMSATLSPRGEPSGLMGVLQRGILQEKVPVAAAPVVGAEVADRAELEVADAGGARDRHDAAELETEPRRDAADHLASPPREPVFSAAAEAARTLPGFYLPVQFEFDSDRLDPSGVREASALAAFLRKLEIHSFTLVGHTDEVGSASYNLDLSLRRARTVRAFLVSQGIHARIHVEGRGEGDPPELKGVALYNDEQRRAIARRVELVVPKNAF